MNFLRWSHIGLFLLFFFQTPKLAHAGICDFLLLSNKVYKEGEEIKSPMKTEPLLVRLKTNAQFYFGLVKKAERNIDVRNPMFLNDFDYLTEKRYDNRLGKMNTFYDPEFDTRFYHSVTAKVNLDGTIPIVDPEARALFIYIHGSGTNKSSGANFSYKGTELSKLGFSALSFDLPFHADGSQTKAYATTEKFMRMVHDIIQKYRVPGQPVYLAGHSFGPEVVFEYVKRYPHNIDGVVALSPAAFNDVLNRWFMESTSQATGFWGDTKPNVLGGVWGGLATTESQWNNLNTSLPDPTVVNPRLKIVALTGDLEEYAPGPVLEDGEPAKESRTYDICKALKVYFKNIYCVREPGVGHYIFSHYDEFGNDIVLREFLRVTQKTEAEMNMLPERMALELKKLKTENDAKIRTPLDKLALKYSREPFFKQWFDRAHNGIEQIKTMVADQDQMLGAAILKQYSTILQLRERALFDNIYKMKDYDYKFYMDNQVAFERVFTPKGVVFSAGDGLVARYLDRISKLKPEERLSFNATNEVYAVKLEAALPLTQQKSAQTANGNIQITLADGSTFTFNKDVSPQEQQVAQAVELMQHLRAEKRHREAQSISEWLNKWVNLVFAKDRSLSSWSFK